MERKLDSGLHQDWFELLASRSESLSWKKITFLKEFQLKMRFITKFDSPVKGQNQLKNLMPFPRVLAIQESYSESWHPQLSAEKEGFD